MNATREERIADATTQLAEALKPDQAEVKAAIEHVLMFVPQDVPLQFTDPDVYPYGKKHFDKKEQAEDAKQPFFSEAYLYTLLGKEDARTLRARMRQLLTALGLTAEQTRELL